MLDIINIPAILGREIHSFKRANVYDKLDLGLAATIGIIGSVVLLLNGFASPPHLCSLRLLQLWHQPQLCTGLDLSERAV